MATPSQSFMLHSWSGQHGGTTRLPRSRGQRRSVGQRSRLPRTRCLAGKPWMPVPASLQRLQPSELVSTPQPTAASTRGHLFTTMTGEAIPSQALIVNITFLGPFCSGL